MKESPPTIEEYTKRIVGLAIGIECLKDTITSPDCPFPTWLVAVTNDELGGQERLLLELFQQIREQGFTIPTP